MEKMINILDKYFYKKDNTHGKVFTIYRFKTRLSFIKTPTEILIYLYQNNSIGENEILLGKLVNEKQLKELYKAIYQEELIPLKVVN